MWQGGDVRATSLVPASATLRAIGFPVAVQTIAPRGVPLTMSLVRHTEGDAETVVEFFPDRDRLDERIASLCGYEVRDQIASVQMPRPCACRWYVVPLRVAVQSAGPAAFRRARDPPGGPAAQLTSEGDSDITGCRVKYAGSGGTEFGYVSKDNGNEVVVQNPWKRYETVPIPKSEVTKIKKADWNDVATSSGKPLWSIESDSDTREMFRLLEIRPRDC